MVVVLVGGCLGWCCLGYDGVLCGIGGCGGSDDGEGKVEDGRLVDGVVGLVVSCVVLILDDGFVLLG